MISCSTSYACTSSTHTVYNVLIRDIYVDCIVNLVSQCCKCLIQCFCLWNCSRKTIQNISVLTIILLYAVYYEIYYQFIRN